MKEGLCIILLLLMEKLETQSEGEAPNRYVVIKFKED